MARAYLAKVSGSGLAVATPSDAPNQQALPSPGAYDARLQAPAALLITSMVGVADTTVALDAELYISLSPTSIANASPVGHIRAAANDTRQLNLSPDGVTMVGGNYLVVNFLDTGTAHEFWIYIEG